MSFTDPATFLRGARRLPDLTPDVAFLIKPDFFYGSWKKAEPNDLRNKVEKLYVPRPTQRSRVLGSAIVGKEQELVRYYQSVIEAAAKHRKALRELSHYFWMRPVLLSRGEAVLDFPWYDTYPETVSLLRGLTQPLPAGLLYDDMDQGWRFVAYATAEYLYFMQGDDDGRVHTSCYTERPRFQALATAALERTRQQLETIVRGVGQDLWRFKQ